jgi:hypothetical protein
VLVTQDIPAADFEAILRRILMSGCVDFRFANCQLTRRVLGDRNVDIFEDWLMEVGHDADREIELAALWVRFRVARETMRSRTWLKWREWELAIVMILQRRWERAFPLREGQDWGDGLEM